MMSYDELDTLVGLLKQSAIDAYMCQGAQGYWSGFAGSDLATWQIAGDKTHYKESHNFHTGDDWTDVTVVRPGSSGKGGGEVLHDGKHHSYEHVGTFEDRGAEIEDLLEPWRDLPDPVRIDRSIQQLKTVCQSLLIDAATSSAVKSGVDGATGGDSLHMSLNANLDSTVNVLESDASHLRGTTAREFKSLFVGTTRTKIRNLCRVAALLYVHMVWQKTMWEGVRQDVESIVRECKKKFDRVAEGASDDWSQQLKMLGLVSSVVGVFAEDELLKVGLAGGDLALEELKETPGVDNGSVGSYYDVLAGLRKSLKQLNDDVGDQEDRIRRSAVVQLDDIWANRMNYPLTGGVRGAVQDGWNSRDAAALHLDEIDDRDEFRVGDNPEVKWDYTIAAGIAAGMEATAGMLESSAGDANHTDVTEGVRASVIRDTRVGVGGGYGPSQAVQELNEALYDLLCNMAGDWRAGAENLRAASTYFEALEEGHVAQLATLGQAVDAAADDVLDGTGIKVHDYRNIDWWERMGGS